MDLLFSKVTVYKNISLLGSFVWAFETPIVKGLPWGGGYIYNSHAAGPCERIRHGGVHFFRQVFLRHVCIVVPYFLHSRMWGRIFYFNNRRGYSNFL